MKRLQKLPRKHRDWIGGLTALIGTVIPAFLLGERLLTFLIAAPFILFFIWLCPELWAGK